MRIGFVLEKTNPVTADVLAQLRARGAELEVLEPHSLAFEVNALRARSELYVLKSTATDMGFTVAAALDAVGARTFNPFPVVALLRNKVATFARLALHGVPTPRTHVAADRRALGALLADGPLIVKPFQGSRGEGVRVVRTLDDLALGSPQPPILAQSYHPADDGLDHKISVIGDYVAGVKRIFPIQRYEDKLGTAFDPSDEVRAIAARIGAALGLDLFSFDVVVSGGRPVVVDVGSFGSYMGVPEASSRLTARIVRAWEEARGR